ncbi:MAG: hypothetical protein HUK03_07090, partial [Bacteroidaceae bacterium]|nr:hypothetical protein [Bacteroidaceae bacterium]
MKKQILIPLLLLATLCATAAAPDSIHNKAVCNSYMGALRQLKTLRDNQDLVTHTTSPDAYTLPLLSIPTLYVAPLHQAMSTGYEDGGEDFQLLRVNYINRALSSLYASNPTLVSQTEQELQERGPVRDEKDEK